MGASSSWGEGGIVVGGGTGQQWLSGRVQLPMHAVAQCQHEQPWRQRLRGVRAGHGAAALTRPVRTASICAMRTSCSSAWLHSRV